MGSPKHPMTCLYDLFRGTIVYVDSLYVDCYGTFQLLLVHDKLLPSDIVMDFPSITFASSLMKAFGLSFMDSLVLLNVERQKRPFLAALCRLTTNIK